jgi:hypothetical protein
MHLVSVCGIAGLFAIFMIIMSQAVRSRLSHGTVLSCSGHKDLQLIGVTAQFKYIRPQLARILH